MGYVPARSPPAFPEGTAETVISPVPIAVPLIFCVVLTLLENSWAILSINILSVARKVLVPAVIWVELAAGATAVTDIGTERLPPLSAAVPVASSFPPMVLFAGVSFRAGVTMLVNPVSAVSRLKAQLPDKLLTLEYPAKILLTHICG